MHVSSIVLFMLWTSRSIYVQICCRWFCGNIGLFCRVLISCCIFVVFFSENLMQNWLIFSGGIGFSILGVLLFGFGVGSFEMILLGGIFRHMG